MNKAWAGVENRARISLETYREIVDNLNKKLKESKNEVPNDMINVGKEENFEINRFKTYKSFGEKVYEIRQNVLRNINKIKEKEKILVGYGAPAKATTALNFFGISNEIDFIIEDNNLKHKKFVPGVNIPIYAKTKIKDKNTAILVLAWNFFEEIKKNNNSLSNKFINIKSLENISLE